MHLLDSTLSEISTPPRSRPAVPVPSAAGRCPSPRRSHDGRPSRSGARVRRPFRAAGQRPSPFTAVRFPQPHEVHRRGRARLVFAAQARVVEAAAPQTAGAGPHPRVTLSPYWRGTREPCAAALQRQSPIRSQRRGGRGNKAQRSRVQQEGKEGMGRYPCLAPGVGPPYHQHARALRPPPRRPGDPGHKPGHHAMCYRSESDWGGVHRSIRRQ